MTPLLQVRQAAFSFNSRQIFEAVDLELAVGEVLTVLGANGCGKSTLLRCIGGALPLRSGKVLIEGENLAQLAPAVRATRMGFLFQHHVPTFPYRVIDVACMGRAPYMRFLGAPAAADMQIAEDALERVGILALKHRPYTALSGGERQLVLLARSLVQSPRVLLLDEPTSHLDLKNQMRCLKVIGQLAAQGMTMIMTTHDPNHAFLNSRRAALMLDGRLSVGPVDDIVSEAALARAYDTPIRQVSDAPKVFVPW